MTKLFFFFTWVLICLFAVNCRKDINENIYLSQNLILSTPEIRDSGILLKWNIPLLNNFQEYRVELLHNYIATKEYKNDSTGIIYNSRGYEPIKHKEINQYFCRYYPLQDSLFFRIVAIGNSIIFSNIQCITFSDIEPIPFASNNIITDQRNYKIYLVNSYSYYSKVWQFDVLQNSFTNKKEIKSLVACNISRNSLRKEFYYSDFSSINILDADNFQIKQSYPIIYINNITIDNSDNLFLFPVSDTIYYTLKLSTNEINIHNLNYSISEIAYMDSKNQFVFSNIGHLNWFDIDENNNFKINKQTNYISDLIYLIPIPNSTSFIISKSKGKIFNLENMSKTYLRIDNDDYFKDFFLDNELIIGLAYNYNTNLHKLYFYNNKEGFSFREMIELKHMPDHLARIGEYIYLISNRISYGHYCYIEKIKFK